MRHLDLFSGIGGFALATEMVWENVEHVFCEIDPFCHEILKKHWPQSQIYGDIRELNGIELGTVDLITGGFPCQPFSVAGLRRGKEDDRHLWPQMARLIKETKSRWVIGENVFGIVELALDEVLSDLEGFGYEVQSFVVPACAVNAPHRRDRVWIVAHSDFNSQSANSVNENERQGKLGTHPNTNDIRRKRSGKGKVSGKRDVPREPSGVSSEWNGGWNISASRICGAHDGLSKRVDRLKSLGNAIVPQVAAEIMKAINLIETV